MYSDVKGGSRHSYLVGCQWLLPPLSVAPSRSDTGAPVYATFLKRVDVLCMSLFDVTRLKYK